MTRDQGRRGPFVREVAVTLAWMAAFVALGAGARALAGGL